MYGCHNRREEEGELPPLAFGEGSMAMVSPTFIIPIEQLIVGVALSLLLLIATLQQVWRPSSQKKNKSQQEKKLPLPPGRFGLPFVGETLEFIRNLREGVPWKFVDDRILAYGETFKTSIMASPTVVLAGPSGHKTAFSSSYTAWPASMVSLLGKDSMIGCAAHRVPRVRNAVIQFLRRPESLQRYTSRVDLILQTFIHEHLEGNSKVVLFPLMNKLMFSIACEVLISRGDRKDQDMLRHPFDTMAKGIFLLPINIPGTTYGKAMAASDAIRDHLQVWIDERRRDMDAGLATGQEDILSGFLDYRDEHGQAFSDKEITDNILTLLYAGHETSASVATMTAKYLASNPHIMDEVYKENKEIMASKAPGEQLLNWGDIQKMKLSWRVVQESMRLMPAVQGLWRVTQEDMSFHGFRIPKSWKIFSSIHTTHRNPKYFPEPEKFDPSRFEGAGPAPYTFVPFGGGPRMCLGNEFARMEILVLIHRLVTQFSWTLEDPNELISIDPLPCPVKGLPILLKPRIP